MNLPKAPDQHDQESISIAAFTLAMKKSDFIIRDVRQRDYGVDLNIEPKITNKNQKYATNYLCQIQIKDKINSVNIKNHDGSYSYSLVISNIYYLLSQPASIFMIYLEDQDKFLWEWIFEIEKFAERKNIDLGKTNQSELTYRFTKELNDKSIREIYDQVFQIGEKIRQHRKEIINSDEVDYLKYEKVLHSLKDKDQKIQQFIKAKNFKEAYKLCSKIADIVENEEYFSNTALLALLAGDYKKACRYSSKSLNINPKNHLVHLYLGSAYLKLKNYNKARNSIEKSLSIKETPEGYTEQGILEFVVGNIDKSIKDVETALILDETHETSNLVLGQIYTSMLSFTKATSYLKKVLEVNPKNAGALALLGTNYQESGKYTLAIDFYHKCLDYDEYHFNGLLGLALSKLLNGDIEEGILFISKWISIHHRRKIAKGQGLGIIYIGWEKSIFIGISPTNKNSIEIHLGDHIRIPVNLPNEKDKVIIGVLENVEESWKLPIVGKVFGDTSNFREVIKNLNERLTFIQDFTHKKQSIDFYNETKLFIKEEKDRVYFEIDFNGYKVTGNTNGNYEKKGFLEFVKTFNRFNVFQVSLYDLKTKKEVFFTVNNNVKIEYYNSTVINHRSVFPLK